LLDMVWARLTAAYLELKDNEKGQALVEYALILALISVVAIAVLAGIGGGVRDKLQSVQDAL
jgi:Flp pilus assembly pilin Flp